MNELEQAVDWLPDVFQRLWHQLVPRTPDIYSEDWPGRRCHEARMIIRQLQRSASCGLPHDVLHYLNGAHPLTWIKVEISGDDRDRRAHVVAQCIDEVFGQLHPQWWPEEGDGPLPVPLGRFRRHYRRHCRFNSPGCDVQVVLKAPLRPSAAPRLTEEGSNRLEDQFKWLTCFYRRVAGRPFAVSLRALAEREDLVLEEVGEPELRFALIPLAERVDDLMMEPRVDGDRHWLDVRPNPGREERLAEKAGQALRIAAEERAQIAVLPELVVSPPVRFAIVGTLKRLVSETAAESPLQMVVAGSGLTEERHAKSGLPFNECVVFGREGQELWRQRKLNHYPVESAVLEKCGIEVSDSEARYRERFHAGRELQVVDSALGRMVVLICQDLFEAEPGERILEQLRPDWAFSPVFDGEIRVGRWTHQRANPNAVRYGVSTIVVNSLSRVGREAPDRQIVGFGLCVDGGLPYGYCIARCGVVRNATGVEDSRKQRRPRLKIVDWRPEGWRRLKIGGSLPRM